MKIIRSAIRSSIHFFLTLHRSVIENYEEYKKTAWNISSIRGIIEFAFEMYPAIKNDWVWELKYIKQSDAENRDLIESKKAEAIAQLQRYNLQSF